MRREWKPGDVAMVTHQGSHPEPVVAIRAHADSWFGGQCFIPDSVVVTTRALVVIDPEDREQMHRLATAHVDLREGFAELMDEPWTMPAMRMRQAARSLITPLKPDEPTGIGAVVEDADGLLWIRCHETPDRAWEAVNGQSSTKRYAQVAAVRVLSEGVAR